MRTQLSALLFALPLLGALCFALPCAAQEADDGWVTLDDADVDEPMEPLPDDAADEPGARQPLAPATPSCDVLATDACFSLIADLLVSPREDDRQRGATLLQQACDAGSASACEEGGRQAVLQGRLGRGAQLRLRAATLRAQGSAPIIHEHHLAALAAAEPARPATDEAVRTNAVRRRELASRIAFLEHELAKPAPEYRAVENALVFGLGVAGVSALILLFPMLALPIALGIAPAALVAYLGLTGVAQGGPVTLGARDPAREQDEARKRQQLELAADRAELQRLPAP